MTAGMKQAGKLLPEGRRQTARCSLTGEAPPSLLTLADKNYTAFAEAYNGSGQAATCGKMIEDYVGTWNQLTS